MKLKLFNMERKLNIDVSESVVKFESLMEKIFPKRIFYKLLLRGKGLEFDSYRRYEPDDDSSSIDWKASLRSNSLLVKQYIEERDIKIMFLIDVSDNMVFGSQEKLKCEYVAEVICAMSYVITNSPTDQIGCIFFNNDIVKIITLAPGKKQFDIICHEIMQPEIYGGVSDIKKSIEKIFEWLDPSLTLVFLVSDFIKVNESFKEKFENMGALFETIALIVRDPLDLTFPDVSKEVVIEDPETGERILVNPRIAQKIYEENAKKQLESTKKIFEMCNVDFVELDTNDDFSPVLANFLKSRVERRD